MNFIGDKLVGRIATWLCVALLIVLSLVPGQDRPHTGLQGHSEHFIAYAGTGMIAMLSYRRALWTIVGLTLLSGILEVLQNFVPGRTPAVMDAIFSSAGGAVGTGMAVLFALAVSYSPTRKQRRWRDR
jgi:VanZ family protein